MPKLCCAALLLAGVLLAGLLLAGCAAPVPVADVPAVGVPAPERAGVAAAQGVVGDALDARSARQLAQAVALLKDESVFDPARALELLDQLAARADEPVLAASARVLRLLGLRLLGRAGQAVAEADALLLARGGAALPASFVPDVFVERGASLALLQRPARAREDFDQALARSPRHVGALLARADLSFALGNPAAAEADYGRALAITPGDVQIWINRGVARDEQGRYAEAVADFTEALRRNASLASAHANRGIALSQLGDVDGMCRDYRAACRLGDCARLGAARPLGYCLP